MSPSAALPPIPVDTSCKLLFAKVDLGVFEVCQGPPGEAHRLLGANQTCWSLFDSDMAFMEIRWEI
jgi:hypothetical protein